MTSTRPAPPPRRPAVPVLMRGSMLDGEIEFAYVDGSASGAPYVELARIGPQMREFYAAVKARSQDGSR